MLHGASPDEAVSIRGPSLSDTGPLFEFSQEHDFYRADILIYDKVVRFLPLRWPPLAPMGRPRGGLSDLILLKPSRIRV
jgi:hypothetical protein